MSDASSHLSAARGLGIGAIAGCVFLFTSTLGSNLNLVHIGPVSAGVLLVAGVLAIVGAVTGRIAVVAAAGFILLAAAVLQLLELAGLFTLIDGDASTMAFLGGLGIGLLVVTLAERRTHSNERP